MPSWSRSDSVPVQAIHKVAVATVLRNGCRSLPPRASAAATVPRIERQRNPGPPDPAARREIQPSVWSQSVALQWGNGMFLALPSGGSPQTSPHGNLAETLRRPDTSACLTIRPPAQSPMGSERKIAAALMPGRSARKKLRTHLGGSGSRSPHRAYCQLRTASRRSPADIPYHDTRNKKPASPGRWRGPVWACA
jgi:hypothetical protein